MRLRTVSTLAALVALAACSTPETRLRAGLQSAGLSKKTAGCMAERMVDKLSLVQLRRLSSLGSLRDTKIADLTVSEFLYKVRALKDPEILAITSKAGLSCAIIN